MTDAHIWGGTLEGIYSGKLGFQWLYNTEKGVGICPNLGPASGNLKLLRRFVIS